ncbi:hypothetical protein EG329_012139 [Mollisiaceae sp. DMI_Dod_QoI]|nr:hypothetical protein EG329_012139 [Helotiales sp. DMI_Dod_QoI]
MPLNFRWPDFNAFVFDKRDTSRKDDENSEVDSYTSNKELYREKTSRRSQDRPSFQPALADVWNEPFNMKHCLASGAIGPMAVMAGVIAGAVVGWGPSAWGNEYDILESKYGRMPRERRPFRLQEERTKVLGRNFDSLLDQDQVDTNGKRHDISNEAVNQDDETAHPVSKGGAAQRTKVIDTIRMKKRVTLPFIVHGEVIFATADSGAEDNLIASHLVETLGLAINSESIHCKAFRVGNGNVVQSLGSTTISCQFANDPSITIPCTFYVWDCLITPMIIGMEFLYLTDTFTKNKYRLETIQVPFDDSFEVLAINNPRRRLLCHLDSYWRIMPAEQAFKANADTGSQVDLISLALCQAQEFEILAVTADESIVKFADGSIGDIFGKVSLVLKLGSMHSPSIYRTFYVLKDLTCDILIGDEVLFENDAFQSYQASMSEEEVKGLSEVNTIVWLNTPERFLSGRSGKAETELTESTAGENIPKPPVSKRIRSLFKRKKVSIVVGQVPSLQARIEEQDARENHRRERVSQYIAKLSANPRIAVSLLSEGLSQPSLAAAVALWGKNLPKHEDPEDQPLVEPAPQTILEPAAWTVLQHLTISQDQTSGSDFAIVRLIALGNPDTANNDDPTRPLLNIDPENTAKEESVKIEAPFNNLTAATKRWNYQGLLDELDGTRSELAFDHTPDSANFDNEASDHSQSDVDEEGDQLESDLELFRRFKLRRKLRGEHSITVDQSSARVGFPGILPINPFPLEAIPRPARLGSSSWSESGGAFGHLVPGMADKMSDNTLTPPGEDLLKELIRKIEKLEVENRFLRTLGPEPEKALSQPEAKTPRWQTFYRLDDLGVSLSEPSWVVAEGQQMSLKAEQPLKDPANWLEKRPDIAFVIYRDYSTDTMKEKAPSEKAGAEIMSPPVPTKESIKLTSEGMLKALEKFMELEPNFNKQFPGFDYKKEIQAPYLFWYYGRSIYVRVLSQLSLDHQGLMKLLAQWIEANYGQEYKHADARISEGFITQKYMTYLVKPGDILVSLMNGRPVGHIATTWAKTHKPKEDGPKQWIVSGWFFDIESDGSFKQRNHEIEIEMPSKEPDEEVRIRDLEAFPLKYASDEVQAMLKKRGETFWSCRFKKFVAYRLISDEGLNNEIDRFMIDHSTYRILHPDKGILRRDRGGDNARVLSEKDPPKDAELFLFPLKIIGYSLRRKKWVDLEVDSIQDVIWNKKAFETLVVDPKTKELIQALITNQIVAEKSTDQISGKGNGLIILLHGGPGTGKTFTAESVAELAERPLYRVTCGDIGTRPEDVEKYLESVLHLGRIWGCVVLLDEADVFLEERSLSDLKRNALVSVFLRVLEYYDGILILTSNRVGTFDEAFKSRIQLALYYEDLSTPQRRKIWRNFFNRLRDLGETNINYDDINDNFDDLAKIIMNGRQIRNSITTARQLAQYQETDMTYAHLAHVIQVANKFDKYLNSVRDGITDAQVARADGVR